MSRASALRRTFMSQRGDLEGAQSARLGESGMGCNILRQSENETHNNDRKHDGEGKRKTPGG